MADVVPTNDPAHTSYLLDVAGDCRRFVDLLSAGGSRAREYAALGYGPGGADPITDADLIGTLAGRTPAHAAAVAGFVAAVDALADEAAFPGGPTYRQAILAMARGAR